MEVNRIYTWISVYCSDVEPELRCPSRQVRCPDYWLALISKMSTGGDTDKITRLMDPEIMQYRRNIEKNVKYGEYHVKHHPYTTSRRTDNCIY